MTILNGTDQDDFIFITNGVCEVNGRKGNDYFTLSSDDDVRIDGGFGHDTFDFFTSGTEIVEFNQINDDKTIIKITDGDDIQKIVLVDVETINWGMIA